MADSYEHYWAKRGKSGWRPRYKIFFDWVEKGSSILEFGSGDGYLGEYLTEQKKVSYLATDLSKNALDVARERGLQTEIVNASDVSFVRKRFTDASYDYVIMTEFLEHIVNSEDVLMEAVRIARKGVLITIPNSAYWRFRLQLLFGNFPVQWAIFPHEHVRFWSVEDFLKTVDQLGLRVEKIKSSNGKKILRDIWPNLFGLQICYFIKKK